MLCVNEGYADVMQGVMREGLCGKGYVGGLSRR